MLDPASHGTAGSDGDNVEAAATPRFILCSNVMVCRVYKVGQLHIGNGSDWINEGSSLPGTHFHENYYLPLKGDDVYFTCRASVVAFEDAIALEAKVECGDPFTPLSCFKMIGFAEEH